MVLSFQEALNTASELRLVRKREPFQMWPKKKKTGKTSKLRHKLKLMHLAAHLIFFFKNMIVFKQLSSAIIMSFSILANGIIHELSDEILS